MAAANKKDGSAPPAPPPPTDRNEAGRPPPLLRSISVRNLFPPLAPSPEAGVSDDDPAAPDESPSRRRARRRRRSVKSLTRGLAVPSRVEDRCALAATEVLLRLRLDIVRPSCPAAPEDARDGGGVQGDAVGAPETGEALLYSRDQSRRTAHPRWDHIDEQLSNTEPLDLVDGTFARFVILDDGENNDNLSHSSPGDAGSENDEWILVEVPLHPSRLRRLPAIVDGDADVNNGSKAAAAMTIPRSLPPNAVLLHYDDGHTRVLPDLYHSLVRRGIVAETVLDPLKRQGSGQAREEREGGMFEERAFDVLGAGEAAESAAGGRGRGEGIAEGTAPGDEGGASETTSRQSVYDDGRVFNLLGEHAVYKTKPGRGSDDADYDRAMDLVGGLTDAGPCAVSDPMTTEVSIGGVLGPAPEGTAVADEEAMEDSERPLSPLPPTTFAKDAVVKRTTQEEVEELRRLVWTERRMLEEERRHIVEGTNQLKSPMQRVQLLEADAFEIMKVVGAERADLFRSGFRLEAHRVRLLQQLRLVFPIRLVAVHAHVSAPDDFPQHQYTISGLPLPDDVHDLASTDDQVSTALGFLCHLVALTSKYLAIPLRYAVVCRWSRSAILLDRGGGGAGASVPGAGAAVYPLFRERGAIDREQLDYGLTLLGRNVSCMLRARGVGYLSTWNALAKMERLLMHAIEGEDPSFGGEAG